MDFSHHFANPRAEDGQKPPGINVLMILPLQQQQQHAVPVAVAFCIVFLFFCRQNANFVLFTSRQIFV